MDRCKKNEIVKLLNESIHIKKRKKTGKDIETAKNIFIKNINFYGGTNNFIINGNYINKTENDPRSKDKRLTEEQARRLHDLKDEVVRLERVVREKPNSPQDIWRAFNRAMGISTMRMLPPERFQEGVKYFQEHIDDLQWLDRLKWLGRLYNNDTGPLEE